MRSRAPCLLAAMSAVFLVLAGCAQIQDALNPGGKKPGPDDDNPAGPNLGYRMDDVQFDFTDAVGIQQGTPQSLGLTTSQSGRASGLLKITDSGRLLDPLSEGTLDVADFFIRSGHIYLRLTPNPRQECVLAQADADGNVYCIDSDILEVDVGTIQFDDTGAIYYLGYDQEWEPVIRYYSDGSSRDYYKARDAITINRFIVTPGGDVLVTGQTEGTVGTSAWLRAIDPTGSTVPYPLDGTNPRLISFMPDGSVLAMAEDRVYWLTEFRRIALHSGVSLEDRWYAGHSGARFPDPRLSPLNLHWEINDSIDKGLLYLTRNQLAVIIPSGLLMFYPVMEFLDVPLETITNGDVGMNIAVIAGHGAGDLPGTYLVDLSAGSTERILTNRSIDVLRLSLQLDAERLVIYGLDLTRNQPVLGEYNLRTGHEEFVDVERELAASFDIIDWNVRHVAPAPVEWTPAPEFSYSVLETVGGDFEVTFDASMTPRHAFIDSYEWDFGDGQSGAGLIATHTYASAGEYTVELTAVPDYGTRGSERTTLLVGEGAVPEVRFDLSEAVGLALSDLAHDEPGSRLMKLMPDGTALETRSHGDLRVDGFRFLDGSLYVRFMADRWIDPDSGTDCSFGRVRQDGVVVCLERGSARVSLETMAVDGQGHLYYLADSGSRISLVRNADGDRQVLHQLPANTYVSGMRVSHEGFVVINGSTGSNGWLRSYDVAGSVVNLGSTYDSQLLEFLPDGSLLLRMDSQLRRARFHDSQPVLDTRVYAVGAYQSEAMTDLTGPRFTLITTEPWEFSSVLWGGSWLRSEDVAIAINDSHIIGLYPNVDMTPVPVDSHVTSDLAGLTLAVYGSAGSGSELHLFDIVSGVSAQVSFPAGIEVDQLRLDAKATHIRALGRDARSGNLAFAAVTIDNGRTDTLTFEGFAATISSLVDWEGNDRPPETTTWQPSYLLHEAVPLGDGWLAGQYRLQLSARAQDPFLDVIDWVFDDGTVASGSLITPTFRSAGTRNFEVTLVNDHGEETTGNDSIHVESALLFDSVEAVGWNDAVFAIAESGEMYAWGSNHSGILGVGHNHNVTAPEVVPGINGVIDKLSLGNSHAMVLTEQGDVYTWGYGGSGELGYGDYSNSYSPSQVQGLPVVVDAAAGSQYSIAVTEAGELYTWGSTPWAHNNLSSPQLSSAAPPNLVAALALPEALLVLDADGTVFGIGYNQSGVLGPDLAVNAVVSEFIEIQLDEPVASLHGTTDSHAEARVYAITEHGEVIGWGYGVYLGIENAPAIAPPTKLDGFTEPIHGMALTSTISLALGENGSVYAWGYEDWTPLLGPVTGVGDEQYLHVVRPTKWEPESSDNYGWVAVNYSSGYAVGQDGSLSFWGNSPQFVEHSGSDQRTPRVLR